MKAMRNGERLAGAAVIGGAIASNTGNARAVPTPLRKVRRGICHFFILICPWDLAQANRQRDENKPSDQAKQSLKKPLKPSRPVTSLQESSGKQNSTHSIHEKNNRVHGARNLFRVDSLCG